MVSLTFPAFVVVEGSIKHLPKPQMLAAKSINHVSQGRGPGSAWLAG